MFVEEGDEEEGIFEDVAQPEGKIGAKRMRKLQEKAEKKAAREVGKEHYAVTFQHFNCYILL